MKEQILRGLLYRGRGGEHESALKDFETDSDDRRGASAVRASVDTSDGLDDIWQRREALIKTGAITPLDDVTKTSDSATPTRRRMSLMDHKIAEGMTVKVPGSRPRRVQAGSISPGNTETAHGVRKERDETKNIQPLWPNRDGVRAGNPSRPAHRNGDSDLAEKTEWRCHNCTSWCPAGATECPDCDGGMHRKDATPAEFQHRTSGVSKKGQGTRSHRAGNRLGNAVECPMCTQLIKVDDTANLDVCLSKHMDRCARRKGRRGNMETRRKARAGE